VTFNISNYNPEAFDKLHFTSGEAHKLDGELVRRVRVQGFEVSVFESAWEWSNRNRQDFDHLWELVGPAGKEWQDPSPRDDPVDMIRIVAVTLASTASVQLPGSMEASSRTRRNSLRYWVSGTAAERRSSLMQHLSSTKATRRRA
jgi:hypothetical protein